MPVKKRWYHDPNWWQVVLTIIGLVVGGAGAYYGFKQWQIATQQENRSQEAILKNTQAIRTQIYQPQNGDLVGETMFVSGYSAYPMRNNYLFVTDVVGGVHYLQRGKIAIDVNGTWSQAATFGDAGSCGIAFIVTEVATAEEITLPTVEQFPHDAIVTPAVRVVREPCKH